MIYQDNTVAFYTFGCKVNQYDTQRLRGMFKTAGWQEVDTRESASLYVINTCTVTADSDRKAQQLIRSLARNYPASHIVVTGCYAESQSEELRKLPNVVLVVGNKEKEQIVDLLNHKKQAFSEKDSKSFPSISEFAVHTRAFVKVQDGCDGWCAYCIVPQVRGNPHSRPKEEIVYEVRMLAKSGYKEIVLSGIRLGIYSEDKNSKTKKALISLIQDLAKIDGIARIRLSSIEPMDIEIQELINLLVNEPKLCHHLHIPLQSGDDAILTSMQRTYTSRDYEDLIHSIRERVPEIAITTDIIVAFPGETESQFQHTITIVERIGFAKVHVFRYSIRPGTEAAKMDNQIDAVIAKRRAQKLICVVDAAALSYKKYWIGKEVKVLVEERRDRQTGYLTGLTSHYMRVIFAGDDRLFNQLVCVKIEDIEGNVLTGKQIKS